MQACLSVREQWESSFNHCGAPVMLMKASLRASKHLESNFHHCGSPVKLVEAFLWCDITILSTVKVLLNSCSAGMAWQSHFHPRGSAVKQAQACFSSHKNQESSFHLSGGTVKLEKAFLRAWKHLGSSFHYCGGHMRLVQVRLCAVMTWESRFDRPGKQVQACFRAALKIVKAVFTIVDVLWW